MAQSTQETTVEPSVDELILAALDLARVCLHMQVGFISEVRDGQRIIRHVVSQGARKPLQAGHADPLSTTYCQRILEGTLPALLPDSHQIPELLAMPMTHDLGIRAYMGVPVYFSDGSVFGTFCCYSSEAADSLDACEIDALQRFAALIAQLLEKRVLQERATRAAAKRVRGALEAGDFRVVYQPILSLDGATVKGYEALSRFGAQPVRPPDQWFQDAHFAGLGPQLEIGAIKKAIADIDWIPAGVYLSLNISPRTIFDSELDRLFEQWPLDRLMLEVTEHSLIENYEALRDRLVPWRARGLALAVDDAGSGYASFRHILQLRPEVIKLDQSLIRDIDRNQDARALAAALLSFAKETGSTVVAEGVETQAELDVLRQLGVDKVQGFLLGRPAPLPAK